jgi:signal transduction histidine kinase
MSPGETTSAARAIRRQVEEMTDMIGNLLAFARGQRDLQPSEVELQSLAVEVRETLALLSSDRRVSLSLVADGPPVRLDSSRLKRIVLNLGKNALEATPAEGSLVIRLQGKADGLDLEVRDSGPGLPAEVQRRLFEPFVTVGKRGGTGLGLAIVKRFVDDHSGRIEVQSTPGQGTTFKVHLPTCQG